MSTRLTIVEGNSNDKDNVRAIMVKGERGYSAYEIAVQNGYTGTEAEWKDSFLNADNYYNKSEVDSSQTNQNNIINKKPYYFNNVANMKAYNLVAGDMAITKGYYSANDGGGSNYNIVNDNTLVDDGGSIIELNNGLRAKLIINDKINVEQFGSYGDSIHNDTNTIQNAINYAKGKNTVLTFSKNEYLISNILINNKILIDGNNSILKCINNNENYIIKVENQGLNKSIIKNLKINGNNNNSNGLTLYSQNYQDTYATVENIEVFNCLKNGINITGDYSNTSIRELKIINCNSFRNDIGIYSNSMSDSYIINSTVYGNKSHGLFLDGCGTIKINNSKAYMNGKNVNNEISLDRIPTNAFILTSDTSPVLGKNYYTRTGNGTWQIPYTFTLFSGSTFDISTDYYELIGNYKMHGSGFYFKSCNAISLVNVETQGNAGDGINCENSYNLDFTNIIAHINGYIWDDNYNIIKYSDIGLIQYFYGIYLNNCNYVKISGEFFNSNVSEFGYFQRSSVFIKGGDNTYININSRSLITPIEYNNIQLNHFNAIINGQAVLIPISLDSITLNSQDYSIINNDFNGSYIYVKNGIAYFKLVIENDTMPVNTTTTIGTISIIKPLLQEIFKGIASTTYMDSVNADATLLIDKGGNVKIRNNESNIKYLSFSGNFIFS